MPFVCSVRVFVCYFAEHNSKVEIDLQLADLIVTFRTVMIENLCRLCQLRRIEKKNEWMFPKIPPKIFHMSTLERALRKHLQKNPNSGDWTTPHFFYSPFHKHRAKCALPFPFFLPTASWGTTLWPAPATSTGSSSGTSAAAETWTARWCRASPATWRFPSARCSWKTAVSLGRTTAAGWWCIAWRCDVRCEHECQNWI